MFARKPPTAMLEMLKVTQLSGKWGYSPFEVRSAAARLVELSPVPLTTLTALDILGRQLQMMHQEDHQPGTPWGRKIREY